MVSLSTGTLLEAGAIMAVVALIFKNTATTETRAERTIRSLGAPASQTAGAVRDGTEIDVPAERTGQGGSIRLKDGTLVAGDAR
jgi:hypothetical protein